MSTRAVLLETGSLDYLLDEANDPVLLEELDIDPNSGYVNQYFTPPCINLEEDTSILLEEPDNGSFLFLEHEYTDYISTFSLSLTSYGSHSQYWGSGISTFSNLTCASLGQSSESTFGYLSSGLTIGLGNLTVDAVLTNIGNCATSFSNLRGLSILGRLNQNFGFLNSSGEYDSLTLGNMSAHSSGAIITPNYGYFVNYIY